MSEPTPKTMCMGYITPSPVAAKLKRLQEKVEELRALIKSRDTTAEIADVRKLHKQLTEDVYELGWGGQVTRQAKAPTYPEYVRGAKGAFRESAKWMKRYGIQDSTVREFRKWAKNVL